MLRPPTLAIVSLWIGLTLTPFHAAESAAGVSPAATQQNTASISGRVQNVVTGRNLNNARVTVKKTDIVTLTDEYGRFLLTRVPAGPVILEVHYTGLDPQQVPVNVSAGLSITQDVFLTNVARYGANDAIVRLDAFAVASTRATDGAEIAINEQRAARNIKNVISTEAYGDVVGGNSMGEFLKFIPGVQTSGGQFESEAVQVRGFPNYMTVVSSNGAQMATSQVSGNNRQFGLQAISINSVARVEVTKVPTPATAADSLAGSVNMVGRNAFESSRAEFKYQLNLSGSSHNLTRIRQPATDEIQTYRTRPALSFNYTLPLNDKLGVVLSGSHSGLYLPQNIGASTFATSAAGTTASQTKPFQSNWALTDGPQYRYRSNLTFKVDWRVAPHAVLSFGATENYQLMLNPSNETINFATGTTGTPTVAGGVPFSYGDTFTRGATGRGNVTITGAYTRRTEATNGENLQYRFDNGDWKVEARSSMSIARVWFRSVEKGNFSSVTATTKVPVRVVLADIVEGRPARTEVFDNNNQVFDPYNPANYNLTAAAGFGTGVRDDVKTYNLDIKRSFRFLPFPASVQVGGALREQNRDRDVPSWNYTYQGPNGDQSSSPYLAQVYVNQKTAFNNVDRSVPWLSPARAFQAWAANPALFSQTPAQLVTKYKNSVAARQSLTEKAPAYYLQSEMNFFSNRLAVLTGVRYEKTIDDGRGPLVDPSAVFVRTANGGFARDAGGNRIRKPEAGAVGSMAEALLTNVERGYGATRSYDGYYPSLHLTGNVTRNFVARAAFAQTYGRPNFSNIMPSTTIVENDLGPNPDPAVVKGNITVSNTGLRPWSADNYDLSLEYYTDSGGLFSAGVFYKSIKDFFGTFATVPNAAGLEAIGLGPEYQGWQVNSTINAGDASIKGAEVSMNQSLRGVGAWGQYFRVFANFTKLETLGAKTADFSGFLSTSANWGVTFTKKPLVVIAKWNYRGSENRGAFATFGPDGYTYFRATTRLDLNLEYYLRPNLALSVSARNVFNVPIVTYREGSQTPDYAKRGQILDFGVPFSVGIKGSF
jgi:TonB-dependent receptor